MSSIGRRRGLRLRPIRAPTKQHNHQRYTMKFYKSHRHTSWKIGEALDGTPLAVKWHLT